MFVNNEDRIVKAIESIAESQMKQTQIAEESFKEAKELRDITMGMMKRDLVLDKSELQTPDSNTIAEKEAEEIIPYGNEEGYDGKIPIKIGGIDCT